MMKVNLMHLLASGRLAWRPVASAQGTPLTPLGTPRGKGRPPESGAPWPPARLRLLARRKKRGQSRRRAFKLFIAAAVFWTASKSAYAQMYISDFSDGRVSEYNPTTGLAIDANFMTGLQGPSGLALAGNRLFVASAGSGNVGEYDATTGAAINPDFITNVPYANRLLVSGNDLFLESDLPGADGIREVVKYDATTGAVIKTKTMIVLDAFGLALSGNDLFVANGSTVDEYNATTGDPIKFGLISGLKAATGLALSGSNLFVANNYTGQVGEYNAFTGAVINANLISGLVDVGDLALSGNSLFAASQFHNATVNEYNATTGAAIKIGLITETNGIQGLAVASIPEPSELAMLAIGSLLLLAPYSRNSSHTAERRGLRFFG